MMNELHVIPNTIAISDKQKVVVSDTASYRARLVPVGIFYLIHIDNIARVLSSGFIIKTTLTTWYEG